MSEGRQMPPTERDTLVPQDVVCDALLHPRPEEAYCSLCNRNVQPGVVGVYLVAPALGRNFHWFCPACSKAIASAASGLP